MLSFFRRGLSSKLALGILALVMLAFVLTGVFDPGTFGGFGGGSGGTVAKVGGEKLSAAELNQRVQSQFEAARQENPGLDIASFVAAGGVEQVLDQVIAAKAVEIWAKKQGIGASDRLVDGEIASVPAFAGPTGKFDPNVFRAALAERRITEQMLRADVAGDLIRRQVLVPAVGAASVPLGFATPYASLLLEGRTGLIGVVPTQAMAAGADPSPADVQAFYQSNLTRYTLPERRVIRYAVIDASKIAQTKPTEADMAAYYKAHAADYAGQESRTFSQVVLPDEAKAKAFAAKVKGGTSFAAAAQAEGFAPSDIALGEKTRQQLADIASPAVAAAAFALPQGGVTEPAKSDFGWHVVRVDAVKRIAGKSLEAARAEIAAAVEKQKLEDGLTDLIAGIEDQVADGATFDDVVKARGLAAVTTPALLPSGLDPAKPTSPPAPELQPLLKHAFEVGADDDPTVESVGPQRFALLDVAQIEPSAPQPLATIRDRVTQDLRTKRASERAKAIATAIMAKVKAGTPIAQAFAQAGVPLPAPEKVSGRQIDLQQQGQQVPPPLRTLFTMKQGDTKLLEVPGDRGWFVINLQSIAKGDATKVPGIIDATRGQFAQVVREEYLEQFLRAVQKEVGVTRNQGTIESVKAQLRGGAGGQ